MEDTKGSNISDQSANTVFFSYSRKDKERALPIITAIEAEGYSVWWDGKLEPGSKYLETTESELENAAAVVVLWSKNSTQSNWVRDEAMVGRESDNLVPLSLDNVVPPLGFRQFQVIDLSGWNRDVAGADFQSVLRQLARLHSRPFETAIEHSLPPISQTMSRRNLIIGGGAAATIGLGAFGIGWSFSRGDGSSAITDNSIVVLPFSNESGEPDLEYISSGLASGVRTALMRNSALRVVARRTSESVQARKLGVKEIAAELGVSFVLDGSLSRVGNGLVMLAELVDGRSETGRWSGEYPARADQLADVHSKLVESIVQSVATDIGETKEVSEDSTTNAAAYNNYLLGLEAWKKAATPEDAEGAVSYFSEAVRIDPEFALAHSEQALILSWLSSSSDNSEEAEEYLTSARQSAKRAANLRPKLAETHSALGWVEFFGALNISEADPAFETSLEIGFGNASILSRYALYAVFVGKQQKANDAIARALSLDPLNASTHNSSAMIDFFAGNFERALESSETALNISPELGTGWYWRAMSEAQLGRFENARTSCDKEPLSDAKYVCSGVIKVLSGDHEDAEKYIQKLDEEYGVSASYQKAQLFAQLGREQESIESLKTAWKIGDAGLAMIYSDPLLRPLREFPEYSALLSDIGFDSP